MNNDALEPFNELYKDEVEKKKAEVFDKIAKMFYVGNFGSATKAEIELLINNRKHDSH